MDIGEWLSHGGVLIIGASALVGALITLVTGGGKLGAWVKAKMTSELQDEISEFICEHKDCKPNTEKALRDIAVKLDEMSKDIKNVYRILDKEDKDRVLIFQIIDALMEHVVHDNHIQEIKELKDKLHIHLLNRQ